jgi:hypothetical protein
MADPFQSPSTINTSGLILDMQPVVPHDTTSNVGVDADDLAVGLYITVGGDVSFLPKNGSTVRTVTVPNNFYLVCSVRQVNATGTTATGIHALLV